MAPRRSSRADFITVRFAKLGQSPEDVALAPDATVADFRDEKGLEDNVQIKRRGTVLDDDDVLADGDRLVLNPKRVTGGKL